MHVPQTEVILRHHETELVRASLPPGEYIIGRSPEVAICADTPLLSRQHARLTIERDQLFLQDLGSANGTFVNDQPVAAITRLFPNQSIRLGPDLTLEVRRQRAPTEPGVSLAPAQAAIRRFLPAEILAEKRYAIGSQIARGGMGAILDARQNATQRTVAMKVMLGAGDEAEVLRFIEEAQVTAQLDHPNIVPIYELGVDEQDQLFYTMKLVRGITLKKVLELLAAGTEATVKKYPLPALLTIFQKVCDAVAFAHAKGVIHRDLKPENIMLGDFGSVLVMDWGLAKVLGKEVAPATGHAQSLVASARTAQGDSGRTLDGTIMGTPAYMSPEQARGEVETLDARSDIYALGAILFELLHLRTAVAGRGAMEIVAKVGRGELDWTPPAKPIPDSLLAVCRKALAFDKAQRYASVEDLQRDLTAYQGGFATSAENAGLGKQLLLALKRHKIAAAGVAAVLAVGTTFGTKAVVEGRRANAALTDLKASAPALLQLAESEADAQRFASALGKLDAALALDPALHRARWQRAWVLLGMERWSEAADALRLARQHDPQAGGQAERLPDNILPAVEKLAAVPEAERWTSAAAREVFAHLQAVEATGPALAFSGKLRVGAEERRKLVMQRLLSALGKGSYGVNTSKSGMVAVDLYDTPIRSLEPVRGLPIDIVTVHNNKFLTDLEPLRGMPLQTLTLMRTGVSDLGPLRGMPLRVLELGSTSVRDLSPLVGMPLQRLGLSGLKNIDLTPLAGMPITDLTVTYTAISRLDVLHGMPLVKLDAALNPNIEDGSPLKGMRLESLNLGGSKVADLSFLQGMPLRFLDIKGSPVRNIAVLRGLPLENLVLESTSVSDLTPLQGAPLVELNLRGCKELKDYTPVLTLPRLERLTCDVLPAALLPLRQSATLQSIEAEAYPGEGSQGARPVAEFWRAYDAHQAAGKK